MFSSAMLTRPQFERIRHLALSLAGIELSERHHELLNCRSRRLGIADGAGLESLLSAVERGESAATQKLFSLLTTKYTGFFRHPQHFQIATARALHAVNQRGQARFWSAGAATGEEPYSLAMTLIEALGEHPPASILATDIDVQALAIGRRGEYSAGALRPLTHSQRARFFLEVESGQKWEVAPMVRQMVEFRPLNLTREGWPDGELFDAIFCRNVLMYLEPGHRYTALAQFASLLAPEGVLILDPTEHLGRAAHLFASFADGVFALRRETHLRKRGANCRSANHES